MGRDSDTQDGLSAHGFVGDELHAWKDRALWDVLASSTGAREQPMGIAITTAGYNSCGICWELEQYVQKVLNATLLRHDGMGYRVSGHAVDDDAWFGLIYALDTDYADGREADQWFDEQHWIKANPNLGVSVFLNDLRAECRKAINSPQSQPEFRTKKCNEWLAADTAWMDMAAWDRCADPALRLEDFGGERCWSALDAAFKTDVFANMRLFERSGHYYAFGSYWLPETKADPEGAPEFYGWAQEGLLTLSPGPVVDIELVRQSIEDDSTRFDLVEVPYDPAQLTQFASEQLEAGVPMVEIRPTMLNFSEPMKRVQELVLAGKFHHNGDPVLRWMVSNVVCHRDAKDNIYPRKPKGEEDARKIDGVIALIMAMARAMVIENAGPPDDYTEPRIA
ncbi:MAG TPA: hypothetical protein DCZ11_10330 [Gammaproteobacteria bacterium]|nr:hypothetical protein [Gammaproteobacteria bacterium]MCH78829.1 hypothetical protein [Gammaproteobacteria bacterium]